MLPQGRRPGSGELSGAARLTEGVFNPCQPCRDRIQRRCHVLENHPGRQSQSGDTVAPKEGIPAGVMMYCALIMMPGPIDLHSQAGHRAIEIQHTGTERMLSPEVSALEASAPQLVPKQNFWKAHLPTQGSCEISGPVGSLHGKRMFLKCSFCKPECER